MIAVSLWLIGFILGMRKMFRHEPIGWEPYFCYFMAVIFGLIFRI